MGCCCCGGGGGFGGFDDDGQVEDFFAAIAVGARFAEGADSARGVGFGGVDGCVVEVVGCAVAVG